MKVRACCVGSSVTEYECQRNVEIVEPIVSSNSSDRESGARYYAFIERKFKLDVKQHSMTKNLLISALWSVRSKGFCRLRLCLDNSLVFLERKGSLIQHRKCMTIA